ncbi:MAG: DNA-binding domain-containing protein [Myxococcota bacterium]
MQHDAPMRGLAAVIRRTDAPQQLQASPRGFLSSAGVEGDDLDQMAGLSPQRLLVYRRLVFNRFLQAVELAIPRAASRRGADGFRSDVSAFLDEQGSRSPYLRDIASEFVRWVEPSWDADAAVPAYLPALARHELLSFEIASATEQCAQVDADELDLERGVLFQSSARVVHYDFAVHLLPGEEEDRTEPSRQRTSLLAYRDREHRVRFLELGTVAASVITELLDHRASLRDAIARGCAAAGVPVEDDVLAGLASLLGDLAERGVLLGPADP